MIRQHRHSTDRGTIWPRTTWPRRAATAAGAATALAVAALLASGAGVAAAGPAVSSPLAASPLRGDVEVSVKPAKNLPATEAEITVSGSGFNSDGELWVAVCQDDGAAPSSFAHCLGGAIPNSNASTAWAVITADGAAPYAGPVAGKWKRGGSFKISLQVPVAVGQDADCVSGSCSVYTRSADDADRSQDAQVPVRFTFAGSSSGGTAPSTEVIGAVPTTVQPDSVLTSDAAVGSDQVVVFSGFTPGEVVDAALYSDPIPLPPVQTDPAGRVTISFTVPEDLPLGTHLVQAIGRKSARVGVAQFTVVDAAATTEATATTDITATATDMTPPTTADTALSAPVEAPPTSEVSTAVSSPPTTAETTETSGAAVAPLGDDPGSGAARLLWLWVVLGALVVIGGAAAIVVMLRRRREYAPEYDDLPLQPVDEVIPAPSWQAVAESGPDPEPPAQDPGPATEQWHPVFDPGPATEQWRPAFDPGPATEQWHPVFDDGDEPQAPGAGRHRSP